MKPVLNLSTAKLSLLVDSDKLFCAIMDDKLDLRVITLLPPSLDDLGIGRLTVDTALDGCQARHDYVRGSASSIVFVLKDWDKCNNQERLTAPKNAQNSIDTPLYPPLEAIFQAGSVTQSSHFS